MSYNMDDVYWKTVNDAKKTFLQNHIDIHSRKPTPAQRKLLREEKEFEKYVDQIEKFNSTFDDDSFYLILDGLMYSSNIGPLIRTACQLVPGDRHLVIVICPPTDDQWDALEAKNGLDNKDYDSMFVSHTSEYMKKLTTTTSVRYTIKKISDIGYKSASYATSDYNNFSVFYNLPNELVHNMMVLKNKLVVAAENDVVNIGACETPRSYETDALVLGSESVGISAKVKDLCKNSTYRAYYLEVDESRKPVVHKHASLNVCCAATLMLSKLEW